jgi:hypothetical protein
MFRKSWIERSEAEARIMVLNCPRCGAPGCHSAKTFSTGSIIVLLAGILLTPVIVGIILIVAAFAMRDVKFGCGRCGNRF